VLDHEIEIAIVCELWYIENWVWSLENAKKLP